MYTVDQRDAVVALENVPNSDTGAPLPRIVCNEQSLFLAFIMSEPDPDWNGTYAKGIGDHSKDMPIAVVRFIYPCAHIFGPTNDEAFAGHPLAEPGLKPYGAFEVRFSSWVRTLERMNSVHPYHQKSNFDGIATFRVHVPRLNLRVRGQKLRRREIERVNEHGV